MPHFCSPHANPQRLLLKSHCAIILNDWVQHSCLSCKETNCKLHWWTANIDAFLCLTSHESIGWLFACLDSRCWENTHSSSVIFFLPAWCKPTLAFIHVFAALLLTPKISCRIRGQKISPCNRVKYLILALIQQIIVHESFSPCLMQFEPSSVLCSVMPGVDTVEVGL